MTPDVQLPKTSIGLPIAAMIAALLAGMALWQLRYHLSVIDELSRPARYVARLCIVLIPSGAALTLSLVALARTAIGVMARGIESALAFGVSGMAMLLSIVDTVCAIAAAIRVTAGNL